MDDGENIVGWYTSIAFDPSGNARVSYRELSPVNGLKVANYVGSGGTGCTSAAWTCTLVDDPANSVGDYTSIAFDPAGNAWVAYRDSTNNALKIANVKRGGEIGISAGLSGANGDAHSESHADMTTTSDITNRDDADCIGGGTWNNGKWFESEEATGLSISRGDSTAQCTEISWNLDLSQAQSNTTYRFVVASKDSFRQDKGMWRGPISVSAYATLTTEASTTKIYSKNNQLKFATANCGTSPSADYGCSLAFDGDDGNDSSFPSLALDLSGTPWIASRENNISNNFDNVMVAKYVGSGGTGCQGSVTAWSCSLAFAGNDGSDSNYISLAFDALGTAWVSFLEYDSTSFNVMVAKYVGSGGTGCQGSVTAWTCSIAFDGDDANDSPYQAIAFDSTGVAWISFLERDASITNNVMVAKYVGSGGTGCQGSVTAWSCSLAFDGDDANDSTYQAMALVG